MKCLRPGCNTEVRDYQLRCPACHCDCGYPNIRAAQKTEEREALGKRVQDAEASAKSRGTADVLLQFRTAVATSKAVLCRDLNQVMQLVSSDNELYASFYQLVGMGARRAEDTDTDRERPLSDDLLFPHYRDDIRFAALSLDGLGVSHYGNCSMVLKDTSIRERTTVFEENSLYFCTEWKLGPGRPVPPGYRAIWDERDHLAAAKLEPQLQPSTQPREFPQVLLNDSATPPRGDFVEVHIFGSLHRQSIERVILPPLKRRHQRAFQIEIERSLKAVGATVEIRK